MKKNLQLMVIGVLSILVVVLLAIALNTSWRAAFQQPFLSKQRLVLATVRGRFVPNEPLLKAVKIQEEGEIFVEVFLEENNGQLKEIGLIKTGQSKDGQFNFNGQVSRLVADDIDQDGLDELLVPTFDQNNNPRLQVFKYQPDLKEFQPISIQSSADQ